MAYLPESAIVMPARGEDLRAVLRDLGALQFD